MNNNLLLVDNDISSRNTLALYLSGSGFQIQTAADVKTAMAHIREATPDLIILDTTISRISGYEFLRRVKKNRRYLTIPFMFLADEGMSLDKISDYNFSCHVHVFKPFDPTVLLSIINNVLRTTRGYQNTYYLKLRSLIDHDLVIRHFCLKFNFTERESSVFILVLRGHTNKEISNTLIMSIRNIENYVGRLLRKTRLRNRTELVRCFYSYRLNFSVQGE